MNFQVLTGDALAVLRTLPGDRYRTIVIDPPWDYPEGWPAWGVTAGARKALDYPAMSLERIKALPIPSLIEREGYVYVWTTNRYLEATFAIMRHWTLVPRQTITWCKPPHGQGPGGCFATTTEFLISGQRIGERSNAHGRRTTGRVGSSWFEFPRGRHSEKPEQFQDMIEKVSPGPYLEIFARRKRPGWHCWGNEIASDIVIPGFVVPSDSGGVFGEQLQPPKVKRKRAPKAVEGQQTIGLGVA